MTNEELVEQIQAGVNIQSNMAELYEQNKNFINKIASPFTHYADIEDLMQEAYFGLEKAVKKYDFSKEVLFITYASYHIKVSIQRYCYNQGLTKRIPIHILEQIHKYHKYRSSYQDENGQFPSDEEVVEYLEITPKKLKALQQIIHSEYCQSINSAIPGSDDMTLEEILPDSSNLEEDVAYKLDKKVADDSIWQAVKELDERSSEIIIGQYKNGLTQEKISEMFEISQSRIGQIQNKAYRELKNNILIQKAAEFYGYDSHSAFHYGIGRFKNTFTSSTEYLALKRLGIADKIRKKHKCIMR